MLVVHSLKTGKLTQQFYTGQNYYKKPYQAKVNLKFPSHLKISLFEESTPNLRVLNIFGEIPYLLDLLDLLHQFWTDRSVIFGDLSHLLNVRQCSSQLVRPGCIVHLQRQTSVLRTMSLQLHAQLPAQSLLSILEK